MTPARLSVTCAWLERGSRVLLARRADNRLWELPGGKVRPGESLAQSLQREIREELAASVLAGRVLAEVSHPGPPAIELHCLACRLLEGEPQALEHLAITWQPVEAVLELELCPADRLLVQNMFAQAQSTSPARL